MTPEEAAQAAEALYLTIFTKASQAEAIELIAEALLWASKPKVQAMLHMREEYFEDLRILRGAIEGAYDDVQANLIDPSLAISRLCALVKYGNPSAKMPDAEKGGK